MAYFNTKQIKYMPQPLPSEPGYVPPAPPAAPAPQDGSIPDIPRPTFSGLSEVILYTTFDDNNVVDKKLENALSFQIAFKEATEIHSPVILLESNIDLTTFNYCKIAITNRYYYIDSIELVPGNLYRIRMHVDVLMSFKDGIKQMQGIMVKSNDSRYVEMDYNDGSFVNREGNALEIKHFGLGFLEQPVYMLQVAGWVGG